MKLQHAAVRCTASRDKTDLCKQSSQPLSKFYFWQRHWWLQSNQDAASDMWKCISLTVAKICAAVEVVLHSLYRTIMKKRELSQKAKLSI